jgi:hypothetical protein
MDWIKKHYDQFLLALAALALLAVSGLLILKTKSFGDNFAEGQVNIVPSEKVPDVDIKPLEEAKKLVDAPLLWQPKPGTNEFLFVSEPYMILGGLPKKPKDSAIYSDSVTGTPGVPNIPNHWFLKNKLPLMDASVPKQDPDKDGFTNEDEWRGDRDPKDPTKWGGLATPSVSTDPNDANSHPKYVSKLFLKQWIRIPFVLLFQAHDGDPKKPAEMTFQINAAARTSKTEFLKLGEIESTKRYRLEKFEHKMKMNDKTGVEEDVSELTVVNVETGSSVVLVLGQKTNSPDSYAEFDYQWNGKTIQVKKLQEFVLLPETDKRYKLVDINEAGAVIRTPDGVEHLVVPDKRAPKAP